MSLLGVKIIFVVNNHKCHSIVSKYFNGVFDIHVYRCGILQMKPVDCVVCPGNSYGTLDNSVSKSLDAILNIKSLIKLGINNVYYGEQPVGTSMIIDLENYDYKNIAYVPVARYDEDISKTFNVYTAFRALLTSIIDHNKYNNNKITSVLCPIFGIDNTMDLEESINQMSIAYSIILMNLRCNKKNIELINKCLC